MRGSKNLIRCFKLKRAINPSLISKKCENRLAEVAGSSDSESSGISCKIPMPLTRRRGLDGMMGDEGGGQEGRRWRKRVLETTVIPNRGKG